MRSVPESHEGPEVDSTPRSPPQGRSRPLRGDRCHLGREDRVPGEGEGHPHLRETLPRAEAAFSPTGKQHPPSSARIASAYAASPTSRHRPFRPCPRFLNYPLSRLRARRPPTCPHHPLLLSRLPSQRPPLWQTMGSWAELPLLFLLRKRWTN